MTPEIKPCPFCGGKGQARIHLTSWYQYVTCLQCEAVGPSCDADVYPNKDERYRLSIEKWNAAPRHDKEEPKP